MKKHILILFLLMSFIGIRASAQDDFKYPSLQNTVDDIIYSNQPGSGVLQFGNENTGIPKAQIVSDDPIQQPTSLSSAPAPSSNTNRPELSVRGIVNWFISLGNEIIVLILGASLVFFLFAIGRRVFYEGQGNLNIKDSAKFIGWGIVALFVMVSVWGLVGILENTFFPGGASQSGFGIPMIRTR